MNNIQEIVKQGGGIFKGIQKGFEDYPDLILFDDASQLTLTTMGLKIYDLTLENVNNKINKARRECPNTKKNKTSKRKRKKELRSLIKQKYFMEKTKCKLLKHIKDNKND